MSEDGSEDTPPRPKRKIKKVQVLSSGSSSDSDESITAVVSDDGSESSSSGSPVVCARSRRSRPLPKLRGLDDDSDTSGWATDHSDAPKPAPSTAKPTSGFASDSSEGNSDKCSICLLRFTNQEVGTPQICEHIFCLDCITEWSKNVNTCPVDRMTFDSIVVRSCAGGRVLRTEPVKVVERRPSIEMLVTEDPTVCEVCGSADNEATMLLCDGCDLGYHMQCLTPPLTEVPLDQWLCPNCDELLSDVDILFSGVGDIDIDMGLDLRRTSRESRGTRSRNRNVADEPSTSSGRRGDRLDSEDVPSTSRGSRTSRVTSSRTTSTRRRNTAYKTSRSRHKRRRTKTVIIEYEVQGNSKFPITKRVKRKIKKKTKRRQTRTAARRTHVRASVRAKLASMTVNTRQDIAQTFRASAGVQELSARRQRAGIPSLSLFGNSHQLDYFSEDDEHGASEGASTAVAVRPTSSILSEYRQARRKMIGVPSPSHASAAPDLLSSILESQTLLHSKKSVVSITVDGRVNIKLESRERTEAPEGEEPKKEDRVDLSRGEDAAKKVPSYPGQSRGGGWGGGYRGSYHREQNANNFNRGGNHENNSYGGGGGYQNRPGNPYHQNNNMQRNDNDTYNNYARRPHQYPPNEELNFDRNRRPPPEQRPPPPALGPRPEQRYSTAPSWQPYTPPPAPAGQPYTPPAPAGQPYTPPATGPRPDAPPLHHRHSFGGFENPLDMRMARMPRQSSVHDAPGERFTGIEASQSEKHHRPFRPLPEPPMFKFDKQDIDKSEDEKSDSGLVIDTEKYDPTEPTNDDDSGDEEKNMSVTPAAVPPAEPLPTLPPPPSAVQSILAGIDTSAMNVPPNVLDSAVRQVLKEHRNLIVAPTVQSCNDRSDEDSDGDCPNFSIYSATSVHIANNTNNNAGLAADVPTDMPEDNLEDLVQEDDETPIVTPESGSTPVPPETDEPERDLKPESIPTPVKYSTVDSTINRLRKTDEELKEKVSKRCPITTNPRNPIKIKLNTPSLIKRQVTLYDEEEEELSEEIEEKTDLASESREKSPNHKRSPVNDAVIAESKSRQDSRKEKETSDQESAQEMKNDSPKKYDKIPGLSDTEDEPPARPDDAKMDVDEDTDRHEQQTDHEEELEPEPRAAEPQESPRDARSDEDEDEPSGAEDAELRPTSASPTKSADRNDDMLEKMTESISETEDERSYTPCLDENKSKDTSMETEKDKGIEGLDTEMISEDEGNGMFSDAERAPSEPPVSPREPAVDGEEGEILDKKKEPRADEPKKKKKKDSKKEGKEKKKGKKGEVAFKKLSKSGKERNYREREKDKDKEGKSKRERRDSSEAAERLKQKRKEKRKDLERYDVRTLVTEKRRRPKDPFGRDVSPRGSPSPSPPRRSASPGPRRSPSPVLRRSPSPVPRRSPSPVLRRSPSPGPRVSPPRRRRASSSPRRARLTPSPRSVSPRGLTPARARRRRRSASPPKRLELRRRRSADRPRKRRRSGSGSKSPRPKPTKRKKRARSERSVSRRRAARRRSPRRRRARRRSGSRSPAPEPPPEARAARSPGSVDSRLLSPRTPPPEPSPPPAAEPPRRARRRRDPERARHRRPRDVAGPSKEVFTSGDNILVSVSFKEQDRPEGETRRERRRERRKRRRRAAAAEPEAAAARPVAIIDLERSPFRELTPSPRNVIVLSDSEPGDKEAPTAAAAAPAAAEAPHAGVGPQTPPTPAAAAPPAGAEGGPATPPEPPESPDAYDPYEPTRSASASPASARVASPQRTMMTLETAQKTNMSADDVIDRRPLSPIEKVMALLQSTRDVSPEPPPGDSAPPAGEAMGGAAAGASAVAGAPASLAALAPPPAPAHAAPPVRIVLPSPTRAQPPKLFLAKPSPIKSDPIKPMQMQAPKVTRALSSEGGAESPYSPGSSDFGDLFSPPGGGAGGGGMGGMGGARGFDALLERPRHRARGAAAKVPVKLNKKKGKTQVGVKIDEDNLKILDDLPSSAVEMQVKSKFLKKLNRQERVVEEVKLVLKPHYNKKHVTKDEYKDILRRAVPKICHNKTGEINPTKIQALVEAYVKKFRKKHKLGLA